MLSAREKIGRVVESWFLTEPLFFAAWTTHVLVETAAVPTIRVGRGRIEYNPAFVDRLDRASLHDVLLFEALRIVLRHPYQRRPEQPIRAYLASNIALQELLQTRLPLPRAADIFGSHDYDQQYMEFYYHRLPQEVCGGLVAVVGVAGLTFATLANALRAYADAARFGPLNADGWDRDELFSGLLAEVMERMEASNSWGTVGGRLRETILATLRPKLNYRDIIRHFRASILSTKRRLTRMKPNRRYGFQQLGSRHEFATRLLFAVDVSGSMGSAELERGFSALNQFFRYGVPVVDVVCFDVDLRGAIEPLRRARRRFEVVGRGGTCFQPIMDLLDRRRDYDGLIVFTDGIAPAPTPPANRSTRVLWLFHSEETYRKMDRKLRRIGRCAFLRDGAAV